MIKKKSNSFLSCDRKTSVNVVIWCPDETEYDEPVAVLQICHGMIEYIDRYDGFARYMAERGFVVVGICRDPPLLQLGPVSQAAGGVPPVGKAAPAADEQGHAEAGGFLADHELHAGGAGAG